MDILFIANDNLCNLIKLNLELLIQNIDIVNSSGPLKNYKSLYNDPDDEIINAIKIISILYNVLVRNMQRNCQKVWDLRKYLEENNGMNGVNNSVDHCTKFSGIWELCTLCTHSENIMIEIEQLSDLENLDIVRTKNIYSYKKCVSDISMKQCDLLYFIKNLKNAYSNVLFPPEQYIGAAPIIEEKIEITENECSICINTIVTPTFIECFHEFCLECIKDYINSYLKSNRALLCPICRIPIKKDVINAINHK